MNPPHVVQALAAGNERGLELDPRHPWLLVNKLQSLRDLDRFEEAERIRDELLSRDVPQEVATLLKAIDAEGW